MNGVPISHITTRSRVAAATLLRVVMWLIGTPFMDFFLMALD